MNFCLTEVIAQPAFMALSQNFFEFLIEGTGENVMIDVPVPTINHNHVPTRKWAGENRLSTMEQLCKYGFWILLIKAHLNSVSPATPCSIVSSLINSSHLQSNFTLWNDSWKPFYCCSAKRCTTSNPRISDFYMIISRK